MKCVFSLSSLFLFGCLKQMNSIDYKFGDILGGSFGDKFGDIDYKFGDILMHVW